MDRSVDETINELAEKIDLHETPAVDNARTAFIAGLNLIPLVGGSLGTLADEYIPEMKRARLVNFVEDLASTIEEVKGEIKADLVHTDQFAYVFEQALKGAADNYQQEKIAAYKAIFVHSLTGEPAVSDEEREIFIRLINNLTPRHIRIMAIIHQHATGNVTSVIHGIVPEYSKEDIAYIMEDLRNNSLLPPRPQIYDEDLSLNFNRPTAMGQSFINFITL